MRLLVAQCDPGGDHDHNEHNRVQNHHRLTTGFLPAGEGGAGSSPRTPGRATVARACG